MSVDVPCHLSFCQVEVLFFCPIGTEKWNICTPLFSKSNPCFGISPQQSAILHYPSLLPLSESSLWHHKGQRFLFRKHSNGLSQAGLQRWSCCLKRRLQTNVLFLGTVSHLNVLHWPKYSINVFISMIKGASCGCPPYRSSLCFVPVSQTTWSWLVWSAWRSRREFKSRPESPG